MQENTSELGRVVIYGSHRGVITHGWQCLTQSVLLFAEGIAGVGRVLLCLSLAGKGILTLHLPGCGAGAGAG